MLYSQPYFIRISTPINALIDGNHTVSCPIITPIKV